MGASERLLNRIAMISLDGDNYIRGLLDSRCTLFLSLNSNRAEYLDNKSK